MAVANATFTRNNSFGKDEETSFARFFHDSLKNEGASLTQGREIWEDVEMVEIILPGNPYTRPVMKVTDEHRQRWPNLYQKFCAEQEQLPEGKPLEEWSEVSRAQVRELKAMDIYTVEQMAQISEIAIARIGMGARVLREKAAAYIAEMEGMAPLNALIAKNEILESRVVTQETQIQELKALLDQTAQRVQDIQNLHHPLATMIPGQHDPYAPQAPAPAPGPVGAFANVKPRKAPVRKAPVRKAPPLGTAA